MHQHKPNLFIVGAARSGTTALWYHLKENPDVFLPADLSQKEPAFFSDLKRSRFKQFENYMELFEPSQPHHKWIGDASTAYLTDPGCAQKIFDFNRESKIIIILRNPVKRAYSLYNWMVQEGYEYLETFEAALEIEDRRRKKKIPNYYEPEYYYNYCYFHSGLYYEQVKRYVERFGRNVLLIKFDDFVKDSETEYSKICRFLDIEPHSITSRPINESQAVGSPKIQFLLRKLTAYCLSNPEELNTAIGDKQKLEKQLLVELSNNITQLKKVVRFGLLEQKKIFRWVKDIARLMNSNQLVLSKKSKDTRDALMKYGLINKALKPPDRKTVFTLNEKYKPDMLKLSEYTGLDLSSWGN